MTQQFLKQPSTRRYLTIPLTLDNLTRLVISRAHTRAFEQEIQAEFLFRPENQSKLLG